MYYTLTRVPSVWAIRYGRGKIDAILQTTHSNAFSRMKMFEFRLKFHWIWFLRVQLTNFQHWFRKRLGAEHRQAIIRTNGSLRCRRTYASLGPNDSGLLTCKLLTAMRLVSNDAQKSVVCAWYNASAYCHIMFNKLVSVFLVYRSVNDQWYFVG